MDLVGQTVEKPQGLSGKTSPGGESEAEGFSEGKPEGAARGFAFGISRGIQILSRGNFFRYHPRLFHNLSDFGFLEVQGSLPRDHYGKILVNPQ